MSNGFKLSPHTTISRLPRLLHLSRNRAFDPRQFSFDHKNTSKTLLRVKIGLSESIAFAIVPLSLSFCRHRRNGFVLSPRADSFFWTWRMRIIKQFDRRSLDVQ
jgi:hypothetical protein